MPIPTIKGTYSLDVETVRELDAMARRWNVSKSEALRRAIREAAAREASGQNDALAALDEIQRDLRLTSARAAGWTKRVRSERRASSRRAEGGGR
jgi:predicted transcriptional regulator